MARASAPPPMIRWPPLPRDAKWVEFEGTVLFRRRGSTGRDQHAPAPSEPGCGWNRLVVEVQDYTSRSEQWIGATIRVQGVCAALFNDNNQLIGLIIPYPESQLHQNIAIRSGGRFCRPSAADFRHPEIHFQRDAQPPCARAGSGYGLHRESGVLPDGSIRQPVRGVESSRAAAARDRVDVTGFRESSIRGRRFRTPSSGRSA